MHLRSLAIAPLVLASMAFVHCGGGTTTAQPVPAEGGPGPGDEAGAGVDGGSGPNPDAIGATTSSKVDLLLVVDNSASMGDKSKLLGASLDPLVRKLASAGDVHLGVITSSLGTMGGNLCAEGDAHQASKARLSTVGPNDVPLASAKQGFLSFGGGGASNVDTFIADAQTLVNGVGENGCGLEAQLESMYRFLVQPDPWASVAVDSNNEASLVGIDDVLLAQRKAFLRPDSLVVVVMITDEDDSVADPLSVGGQGWAFMDSQFPGSPVFRADGKTTTAPRATTACAVDPGSPDCTSCAFANTCAMSDPSCQKIKNDPNCSKLGGYYGPTEDQLNIRFQRMKERFGIDPQYPISRYVDGFTKSLVPNRDGEHTRAGGVISAYKGTATCTNPLFAAALPDPGGELCNLPKGPRGKDLVVFALIGGVPEAFAGATPSWQKILGTDPGIFNYEGIDTHMIQSASPRPGLPMPSSTRGDLGPDPINGREWDTAANDLQYACTFTLPSLRTCVAQDTSCDCASPSTNPPLCGATLGQQVRGKAYPTVRELRVVKALGDRGILGSICPGSVASGYTGSMTTLANRLAPHLK